MKQVITYLFILVMALFLVACDPIWIPDPINPGLPKYTDTGNNVAGAMVNGKLWRAKLDCFLFGCYEDLSFEINQNGSLSVQLDGKVYNDKITFNFNLANQPFLSLTDKLSLNNKKFVIDGNVNTVTIFDISNTCAVNVSGVGQIYFKHVKKINEYSINYSGTFGFVLNDPSGCGTYEVFYGRFDYTL